MLRVLAVRDARNYLVGQLFSIFGDSMLWLAMGVWVKELTGSSSAAGLTMFAFVAGELLAPLSGLLVDRVRRKPLLVVTNLLSAVLVLPLLLVEDSSGVWIVYAVMFAYGVATATLDAGQTAILPELLPEELLAQANGFIQVARQGFRLVAPLLGAGAVVLVGAHWVVVADAATFAVATLSLLFVRGGRSAPRSGGSTGSEDKGESWTTEMLLGLRHIRRTPALRQILVASTMTLSVFGFAQTVLYTVVDKGLGRPSAFVGVLISIQGVGALAAGLTAAAVIRRLGEKRTATIGFACYSAGVLLLAPSGLAAVAPGAVLCGFAVPWILVPMLTLSQRMTPSDLQGRVHAAFNVVGGVPQTVSIALGAALTAALDYRIVLSLMFVVTLSSSVYLGTRRPAAPEPEPVPAVRPAPLP
ncbi:MFS transporter [Streptomyces sp. NBC_01217]|uniref:MFS transporter n=1 Tax=Streptomyces sp. NBC_01217 TaxID=2903779 RepID=UPI002E155D8F|nr:MFS transporter [Streptomyces sp. NBC_01217]